MNQPAPLTAEDVELFEALRKEDLEYSPAHHWQQLEGLTTDAIVEEAIRATQEVCAGDTEDPSEPEYDDAQKDRLRQEWLCFIRGGGISSLSWTLKAWLHDRSPTIFDRQADWKPPPATPISKAQAARGREIDAEVASLKGNALTLYAEKALLEADKKDLQAALEGTATAAAIRADTKPKRVTEDFLAKVRGCITSEDNPIVRAFKVGEAKKVHYLVCQDGTEIRLGTSREIGTTGAIEAAILNDAPMMRVVALKPAERSDLARAICNLCVQVDVGSEKEEAANWIRSYLAQSTIIEAGDSMKAAWDGIVEFDAIGVHKALRHKGDLHIPIESLSRFLGTRVPPVRISLVELGDRLRAAHVDMVPITGDRDGKRKQRKLWRVPSGMISTEAKQEGSSVIPFQSGEFAPSYKGVINY